ncbi:translation initiation factor eIF-1/SUI1-like protein [Bernardetia litoralis DSM 6794]|uniref:Translation initiation factor eIF-1/SUI1-like protein n=1 Tax=Bernardetia litoralis (strain ATCC 23117 / DSM 6794 / NBRC 15988 / NCIMB 1366 / Fx l1 / Sio-4) TaxID=880071 RepID=I4AMN0_BERLS|nr:translation initiation factor [Bernardetia litoralis]AFM05215.1 translation initiation factor eIF-1/SUI1-like protein [Bernardetia litoralis DSM 6794]
MARDKKKKRISTDGSSGGMVFSTNPDFEFQEEQEIETLPNEEQRLKVSLDRKKRKGKTVVLIENFEGKEEDLKELAKQLKNHCGVGGSAKDGEIIIQGELLDKVKSFLKEKGFKGM